MQIKQCFKELEFFKKLGLGKLCPQATVPTNARVVAIQKKSIDGNDAYTLFLKKTIYKVILSL